MRIASLSSLVPALAAVASLSFTPQPAVTVAADSTWEAVSQQPISQQPISQQPQGPKKAAAADEVTLLTPASDLALANWPGLGTVGGLGSLSGSPLASPQGGGTHEPAEPGVHEVPNGRLLPPMPTAPLSPFMP